MASNNSRMAGTYGCADVAGVARAVTVYLSPLHQPPNRAFLPAPRTPESEPGKGLCDSALLLHRPAADQQPPSPEHHPNSCVVLHRTASHRMLHSNTLAPNPEQSPRAECRFVYSDRH